MFKWTLRLLTEYTNVSGYINMLYVEYYLSSVAKQARRRRWTSMSSSGTMFAVVGRGYRWCRLFLDGFLLALFDDGEEIYYTWTLNDNRTSGQLNSRVEWANERYHSARIKQRIMPGDIIWTPQDSPSSFLYAISCYLWAKRLKDENGEVL